VDEDGTQASFAGMHDTFLNIKGLDAILEAIQKCWASAVSERAVVYRHERGLPVDDIQIAVLVQQLVPADVSGIAFSLNPVTGSQNEIIMTSSWGLGESIVGGSVTPDTVTVRKSDLAITAQDIGRKMRMTIAVSGSTKEVAVPRFLQEQPCLEESNIQAIARMVRGLEDELDMAVDIEYAIANGELFLLQCRPVTGHIR
jgi:pyruvate,water dikinase